MTTATNPHAARMRRVASTDDSFAAGEILDLFIGDEPWKLDALVPGGSTFNAARLRRTARPPSSTSTRAMGGTRPTPRRSRASSCGAKERFRSRG